MAAGLPPRTGRDIFWSLPLVTLVSHLQLLCRGVTQGGVAPVFPFGLDPTGSDTRAIEPRMQNRPTVGPGSQCSPFGKAPWLQSKLGKGAAVQMGHMRGGDGGGVTVLGEVLRGEVVGVGSVVGVGVGVVKVVTAVVLLLVEAVVLVGRTIVVGMVG